jgi:two-component sensor histidine kinase
MLREIHHRVMNNLQMISSLLRLQASRIRSLRMRRVFAAAQNRVQTMAALHHHLYERTNWAQVDFEAFLNDLVRQLSLERGPDGTPAVRFDVSAPVLAVGPDVAVPVGLVVTEAVTNAVTHAFAGIPDPRVTIRASHVDDSFVMSIDDNGTGIAPDNAQTAAREGLGFTLLRGLAMQLGGNISVSPHAGGGTRVLLTCPGSQFSPVTSD